MVRICILVLALINIACGKLHQRPGWPACVYNSYFTLYFVLIVHSSQHLYDYDKVMQ